MAKRNQYEVVDFKAGGFFLHGGNIGETYFKSKEDADEVCAAMNMVERLKLKSTQRKIEMLGETIRQLEEALKNGTVDKY